MAANAALATTVIASSETELVALADTIVVGSVVQTETIASDSMARTRVLLQVHRGLRGAQEGEVVTLDLPGGTLGGITHQVSGVPVLQPGQMVVAFLESRGAIKRPLGLAYGVYNVSSDVRGAWQASRNLRDLSLVSRSGQAQRAVAGAAVEDLETLLARLESEVRALPAVIR